MHKRGSGPVDRLPAVKVENRLLMTYVMIGKHPRNAGGLPTSWPSFLFGEEAPRDKASPFSCSKHCMTDSD